jgi:hypothetical protein
MAAHPAPKAQQIKTTDFTDFTDFIAASLSVKSVKSVVPNDSASGAQHRL